MTVIGCRKECYNLGSRMWMEAAVPGGEWAGGGCIVLQTLNLEELRF